MSSTKSNKHSNGVSELKMLITAVSVATTLFGWAMLSSKETNASQQTVAQNTTTPVAASASSNSSSAAAGSASSNNFATVLRTVTQPVATTGSSR